MSRRVTLNLTGDQAHALLLLLERVRDHRFPRAPLLAAMRPIEAKLRRAGREGTR